MTVGRVKGTAVVSGRDHLEMIRKRVQSAHRRAEIRLVAIDCQSAFKFDLVLGSILQAE
jgi:hypothetical protein